MAHYRDRLAAITYPDMGDWPEFARLTAQHTDLQARYRAAAEEADRLDRSRDTALEADREAYAQALLDGQDDPGQAHTQAHDKAAADKRRECDALRVAVQRTEDAIQDLLETEGQAKTEALESQVDADRRKAQAAMTKLAALLGSVQETKAQVAWARRAVREGRPTSYKGGAAAATGYAEGLKGPNGYDHTLADVFAALDRALQPPAPTDPRRPGRHVPPDQQNWGHVGAVLASGGGA